MISFLRKIEGWLDRRINKVDRQHQFLRSSDRKWQRWLWKTFFRKREQVLDFFIHKSTVKKAAPSPDRKVIHVVNLLCPHSLKNKDLAHRVSLTLKSIEEADRSRVILLGCVSQKIRRKGWEIKKLQRDATTELGNRIDAAYLKDMLDAAGELAEKGDIIFYSNLDCPVHPDIYQNLLSEPSPVTEFIRRDVSPSPSCDGPITDYREIFHLPFVNYSIGVDGVAFTKEGFSDFREIIPDFVIGEPHWDTAVSGILHQAGAVKQNTEDLYHITHPQQWDDSNLSEGGKHNKHLYRSAVEYGLMADHLISIKKGCAIVVLKDSLVPAPNNTLKKQLRNLSFLQGKVEAIFCDYNEGSSELKPFINHISYLPISPTNDQVKLLNQKNTLLNLLRHYFADYRHLIVCSQQCPPLSRGDILKIQEQLRSRPIIQRNKYTALKPSGLELKVFDFFVENEPNFPNISSYSFINDDGLLQLLNNYGHFQSPPVPGQGTQK
jgi:hypothetical protein